MYAGKRTLKQILNTGFKYKGSFRKFWDYSLLVPSKRLLLLSFVVDINCEVTAGHKYVHFSSPSGIAPGGCFHFITVQSRHLFKKTTFTVSTLPRARPQPPTESVVFFRSG